MRNDNAYPSQSVFSKDGYDHLIDEGGLTKRELFAAMAMQGLCGNGVRADYSIGSCNGAIVERAVVLADILLAELAKKADGI